MLQFDVAPGVTQIADGLAVIARAPDGTPTYFETGTGLAQRLIDPATGTLRTAPPQTVVSALWNSNSIEPYWYDDSQLCLPVRQYGSSSCAAPGQPGQKLLIETQAETTPIRLCARSWS
jgi:hypothetical protein